MNPSGHPTESSRALPPLSPLAPPFEPRDPSGLRQIQSQIESMQQRVRGGLNTDETIQASSYLTCPLELSLVPEVRQTPNHCQTEIQPGAQVLNNHFIHPESDRNISQNVYVSESFHLQEPIQGSFPVLYPLNWTTMSNGNFIPCHPSGMRLLDNQISYSQFDNNTDQNFFVPDGFNPHGGVSSILPRPVDQASLSNSENQQNPHHFQSDPLFDNKSAPDAVGYADMNPRLTTHASGPLALPFGVHMRNSQFTHPLSDRILVKDQNYFATAINPHRITQVNSSITQSVTTLSTAQTEQGYSSNIGHSHQLRNRSDLSKWPMTSSNPPRLVNATNLYSSNYKSPPSTLFLEHQLADVRLDTVQGSLDKEYVDESDVELCDLHYRNIFWQLPRRLFEGHGTPCFVCRINAEVGIVIPGAGKMSGTRDGLEGACALPLMASSTYQYNAQFPSLPSSQPKKKKRGKADKKLKQTKTPI